MNEIDKYNIKQEIGFVYITKDGKKFCNTKDAIKHSKNIKNKFNLKK